MLKAAYRLFPFSLQGDALIEDADTSCDVSCIVNFYGRIDLLEGILFSLVQQDFPVERFEVVLVEDRGGTEQGKFVAQRFGAVLNIQYHALPDNFGVMGYSRNYGLLKSKGKYIIFLDDDTVILQKNFLSTLSGIFASIKADGVIPHGMASYYILKGKYGYHEPYFPTSRCTAYRRESLKELGGFVSSIIGQEDVEFVIRFLSAGKHFHEAQCLEYFHPPVLMPNLRKPKAVGNSFYHLKNRYPLVIWFLLILNCTRQAPYCLIPIRKFQERGRFGIGFFLGVLLSPFKKKGYQYS